MVPYKALLSFILISLISVDATPRVSRSTSKASLSFATKFNASGTLNIAEKDRTRAQALQNAAHLGKRGSTTFSIMNTAMTYAANVGVGSPPNDYTLVIDTGSSNTVIGVSNPYIPTSTSKKTGNTISISYGDGDVHGEEWIDTVTLAPGLVIKDQSIGVASSSTRPSNVHGVLGLGPVDLTAGTVKNTHRVPTVMDNLLSQGTISTEVLGVHFVPDSESSSNGMLTFGGYDHSVITSAVNYVPLTTAIAASGYWGIDQSITYGGSNILSTTAGLVDTGTTLILIATDAFNVYTSATGGTLDHTTGLLTITSSQYSALKTLSFHIGGHSYDLSPNAQIWPRSLNHVIGGTSNSIYLIVSDIGKSSRVGFVNGYTFLERYYTVFDTTQRRVGFATTVYTEAATN